MPPSLPDSSTTDEAQIRALVATWMAATKEGDIDTVLGLMTDDVVFLVPGNPPMRKSEFAAASRAQSGAKPSRIDAKSEIQEIEVAGDRAFTWARLSLVVTPRDGSAPVERKGHTLTVFKKEGGRWRLARDANLLGPAS